MSRTMLTMYCCRVEGRRCIHRVKCILLQDDEINDLGLVEHDVVLKRHAVIARGY